MVCLIILLQSCSTNNIADNFSYESLKDNIIENPFRNRKFDYARIEVNENKSLKIPDGLNGNKINPALELPQGNNKFAKNQLKQAEQEMLPPYYNENFDMSKIVRNEISTVSISVIYNDKGALKLVFHEPLSITIEILKKYFKNFPKDFKIISENNGTLTGYHVKVKDTHQNLTYVLKVDKVDELSSLITITDVFKGDSDTEAKDNLDQGIKLLTKIRKDLNGVSIAKQDSSKINQLAKSNGQQKSSKGLFSLGSGILNAKDFSFGQYSESVKQSDSKQPAINTAPTNKVYDSDSQPQILNT